MYKKVYWNNHEDAKRYLSVSRSSPGPRGEIGAGVRNCKPEEAQKGADVLLCDPVFSPGGRSYAKEYELSSLTSARVLADGPAR